MIAGNISPMDVISHLPILCEDNGVPYIYVRSKEELGAAALTKRYVLLIAANLCCAITCQLLYKLSESKMTAFIVLLPHQSPIASLTIGDW